MAMLKISSFLAVYALVVCQMESYQAVPLRPGLEPVTDRGTLGDYEARRLLNALVKEYVQMTAEELEQASEGNRRRSCKRGIYGKVGHQELGQTRFQTLCQPEYLRVGQAVSRTAQTANVPSH
ncbi:calcitonin gene-related peptide 1 isoform X2 [Pogona vitticeps]|uniref:Calcitonin gene-related peptide 1 isoform X2 n=1 Tax=Pogona vitticeps TaxID=103695 RepID=A0ABM5F8T9_9SAUR